jgi:hypothetical protein
MQKEANEYRVMYSEARHIFDKFSDEVRNGTISYGQTEKVSGLGVGALSNPLKAVVLVSSDAGRAVMFRHDGVENDLEFAESLRDNFGNFVPKESFNLNSDRIKVDSFKIYISPLGDPYSPENVDKNVTQYQPKVTVFAQFQKDIGGGKTLDLDLQTTISSRSYMPGYFQDDFIFGSTVETQ